jgi:hypothetical protein
MSKSRAEISFEKEKIMNQADKKLFVELIALLTIAWLTAKTAEEKSEVENLRKEIHQLRDDILKGKL